MNEAMRERLIVGLDVASLEEAESVVATLGDLPGFYKIGHQLLMAGGLGLAKELAEEGRRVFLDVKLLDIDNTVAKAVENAARMGFAMLTLHAYPKTMRAAAEAARGSDLCLLGVTVLTSMDDADLREAGYARGADEMVELRSAQAREAGIGGIVCSAAEAAKVRAIVGDAMAIVTPGIRPSGTANGDQKRVMTPAQAIRAGASHLVVARPILNAPDRLAAAKEIIREMELI